MHDERWLVKSSGRVLGPFTLEELIQHLRARTLSIIDEVRDPNTRWSFVREHPLLREVVRQLRNEQDEGPDNTQTTFVGTATSRTTTVSITETNSQEGELTPNPSRAGTSGGVGDARPINATERTIKSPFGSSNSYGSLSDTRVQKKVEKRRSFLRNVLLLGLFGVLLFGLGYFYNQKKNKGAALDQAKHALTMAREQTRYGQYEKGLGYMAKARGQMVFGADDNLL